MSAKASNGSTFTVLKGTTVQLVAPQNTAYKYNYYLDNWEGSGAAFTANDQSYMKQVTSPYYTFTMYGAADVKLTTVKNPAFFG